MKTTNLKSKYLKWLMGLFFIGAIAANNNAYSFTVKPTNSSSLLNYAKGHEFIKLSYKKFATLTGEKKNLWNKISFNVMKLRIRHDLKKNPDLQIKDYVSGNTKNSWWFRILIGVLILFVSLMLLVLLVSIISSGHGP
ncbi:MAG: hypothetical protein WKF85_10930 [Chitinophagaceae bacterium]